MKAGLSADAARKRLSRLPAGVNVLRDLPFPKGARFIYLSSQYGSLPYWDSLINAAQSASPPYANALLGIKARGGMVPLRYFDIASGAPTNQTGQISSPEILRRLLKVGILKEVEFVGIGKCIMVRNAEEGEAHLLSRLRARNQTESIILEEIKRWAIRLNISSPNTIEIRSNERVPNFGTCSFDICGPSYLRPLVAHRGGQLLPGFFVADVIMGKELESEDVAPYIRKCCTLGFLRNRRPFLPMIIAESFSQGALHSCRSQGIMATTPGTLFGQDVGKALSDLMNTLCNAAAIAATNPDKIERLLGSLSAIEGAAGNIRGALFELVVGHMVRAIEGGSIDIGLAVQDSENGKRAEVDVLLVKERVVQVYECKGYQPTSTVSVDEIKEWLEKKVPTIYNAIKEEQRFRNSMLRFEYWTTGKFSDDAISVIESHSRKVKKYEIGWSDGSRVLLYSGKLQSSGIKKVLKEHYFSAPATTILPSGA